MTYYIRERVGFIFPTLNRFDSSKDLEEETLPGDNVQTVTPSGDLVQVFRLEYGNDMGVYDSYSWDYLKRVFGWDSLPLFMTHPFVKERHPLPCNDGLDDIMVEEKCCFSTPEAFREWFILGPDDLERMHDCGMLMKVITVDKNHVREGQRQTLYMEDKVVREEVLSPLDIKNYLTEEKPCTTWE